MAFLFNPHIGRTVQQFNKKRLRRSLISFQLPQHDVEDHSANSLLPDENGAVFNLPAFQGVPGLEIADLPTAVNLEQVQPGESLQNPVEAVNGFVPDFDFSPGAGSQKDSFTNPDLENNINVVQPGLSGLQSLAPPSENAGELANFQPSQENPIINLQQIDSPDSPFASQQFFISDQAQEIEQMDNKVETKHNQHSPGQELTTTNNLEGKIQPPQPVPIQDEVLSLAMYQNPTDTLIQHNAFPPMDSQQQQQQQQTTNLEQQMFPAEFGLPNMQVIPTQPIYTQPPVYPSVPVPYPSVPQPSGCACPSQPSQQCGCNQPTIVSPQPCPLVAQQGGVAQAQENGICSWMIDPLKAHQDPKFYLQCQPAPGNEFCGRWRKMCCAPGTIFNEQLQVCTFDPNNQPGPLGPAQQQCGCQTGQAIGQCGQNFQCPGQSVCQVEQPQNQCPNTCCYMGAMLS